MPSNSRVCDRCIRRKVKCDQQRPQCSRCSESGHSCSYSREKRKPGPQRGVRSRPRVVSSAKRSSVSHQGLGAHYNGSSPIGSSPEISSFQGDTVFHSLTSGLDGFNTGLPPCVSMVQSVADLPKFPGYYLNPSQEREILLQFFSVVHSAIPLLQKDRFLKLYEEGLCDYDLVVTMVAVTTKILGPTSFWMSDDVDLCIHSLLMATAYEDDFSNSQASLSEFQRECLLAYYNFHQFPGRSAWMRISRLTRRAYAMGLNQIEDPYLCCAYDAGTATEEDIEDWRYVWWCVYCFDSYSNMSLGTPFVVDMENIGTALVRRSSDDSQVPGLPKLFLPEDTRELWRTTQDVMSTFSDEEFNINIITTTLLRQAGNILRFRYTKKKVTNKIETLRSNLASLRLALPQQYLNPQRIALAAESSLHHHTRLTSVLRLHMASLIISLPQDFEDDKTEWLNSWQQILGTCQDVVLVIEQWNSQFSSHVDPAICLIVFFTLWVTNLHRRSVADAASLLLGSLIRAENNLILFLEQFSRIWTLPKILLQLFRNSSTNDVLTYAEIDRIINQFRMPLHPKAMQRAGGVATDTLGGVERNAGFVNMLPVDTQSSCI